MKTQDLPDVPDKVLQFLHEEKRKDLDEIRASQSWVWGKSLFLALLLPIGWFLSLKYSKEVPSFPFIMILTLLIPLSALWVGSIFANYRLVIDQIRIESFRKKFLKRDPKIAEKILKKNYPESHNFVWECEIPSFRPIVSAIILSLPVMIPLFVTGALVAEFSSLNLSVLDILGYTILAIWAGFSIIFFHKLLLSKLLQKI